MRNRLGRFLLVVWLAAGALAFASGAGAQSSGSAVFLLAWDGPLTPPLLTYLERGLNRARDEAAALIVLQLNTPGGQVDLMEKVVGLIRNSPTPIVVYVAPRGALAASAGTFITLAGHAAAMAPETSIGAASPIGGQGEELGDTASAKAQEALRAQIRGLADRRGPEAVALAEATISEAKAVTADEALAAGLVDAIAADLPDLLRQLDEFEVEVGGQPRVLLTRGLIADEVEMTWVEMVLDLLTNPNLVYLLLTLGGLLVYFEIQSPGGWVSGFLGAVCLALAFYGLGVLSVNWFGIVFIIIGFVLFGMDLYAASHGALTIAGGLSLVVGALVLFNSPGTLPFFQVNVPLVIATTIGLSAASLLLLTYALRSLRRPVMLGPQTLVGQVGEMRAPDSVQVAGELWSVEPDGGPLEAGDRVEVVEVKGLRLKVRRQR